MATPCAATDWRFGLGGGPAGLSPGSYDDAWKGGISWGAETHWLWSKHRRIFVRYNDVTHPASSMTRGGDWRHQAFTTGVEWYWRPVVLSLGWGYGNAPHHYNVFYFNNQFAGAVLYERKTGFATDFGFGFEFPLGTRAVLRIDLFRNQTVGSGSGHGAYENIPQGKLFFRL